MLVNAGRDLQVTMEARTGGWLALGFAESPKMRGADMVYGWVSNDAQSIELVDAFAQRNEMPRDDVSLSGHNDVFLLKARRV